MPDPLEARRLALHALTDDLIVQLRGRVDAHPWLIADSFDPVAAALRLTSLVDAARSTDRVARFTGLSHRRACTDTDAVLAEVATWQGRARGWLMLVRRPESHVAVKALRRALSGRTRTVASALGVVRTWQVHAEVHGAAAGLSRSVAFDEPARLRARLEGLERDAVEGAERVRADAAAAKAADVALRRELRDLRWTWRLATLASAGNVPGLNWSIGAAAVARRGKRADRDVEPAEDGRADVAG